jgi:hypothetical protein
VRYRRENTGVRIQNPEKIEQQRVLLPTGYFNLYPVPCTLYRNSQESTYGQLATEDVSGFALSFSLIYDCAWFCPPVKIDKQRAIGRDVKDKTENR